MKKNSLLKSSQEALDIAFYLNHTTTIEILKFIKKKPRSISEVKDHLKMDYKNTYQHIQKLENLGLLKKTPRVTKKSKIMEVSVVEGGGDRLLDKMKSDFDKAFDKAYKS